MVGHIALAVLVVFAFFAPLLSFGLWTKPPRKDK
jgi:hypothetical protein